MYFHARGLCDTSNRQPNDKHPTPNHPPHTFLDAERALPEMCNFTVRPLPCAHTTTALLYTPTHANKTTYTHEPTKTPPHAGRICLAAIPSYRQTPSRCVRRAHFRSCAALARCVSRATIYICEIHLAAAPHPLRAACAPK